MKPIILLLVMVMSISSSFAQTKKIAHKSHSGSNKTFTTKGNSNFGESPEMIKRHELYLQKEKEKKDSIAKAKADSIAKVKAAPKQKKPASKTKKS